ncbi:SurA N-terminal domain-containing protein [Bacillus suaedae]|uniref:peptidylprolyl isomerase n=1 Tax=Halalkalibacter suaedae TaxID=2822140 RepID=A0A940X0K3_9BACI|nr:SurA N-terminal domain-containing protein [Bacillus suaedae]MBP3952881.1 SurA N-terminal domain-containing protein [Bacillus suaedae]
MNKKWLLGLSLAGLLAVSTACNSDEPAENSSEEAESTEEVAEGEQAESDVASEQPEMPEPDLEGIPEVVAAVNGEEILKEEFIATYQGQFQQAMLQAQMSGQEIDQDQLKEQIAESMIGQTLLIQEANDRDLQVSEEEINQILDRIQEQNGLESREALMSAFEQQGLSEAQVMSEVEMQVKIDQMIANESGEIEVTDEELNELYEMFVAQQEQMGGEDGQEVEVPSFDEIKSELENQVRSQKEAELAQAFVESLRADADVTVNL